MSFLYKALLKDNHKQSRPDSIESNQETTPQANSGFQNPSFSAQPTQFSQLSQPGGFQQQFANSDSQSSQGVMWFAIAVLLLVVGLLAGYIWGNQSQFFVNPQTASIPTVIEEIQVNRKGEQNQITNSSVQDTEVMSDAVIPPASNVSKNTPALSEDSALANLPTKQVEIAVDSQGNLVSKVSKPTDTTETETSVANAESTVTESIVNEPVQSDEVSIDDIPEELKALFAEAVKATETDDRESEAERDRLFSREGTSHTKDIPVNSGDDSGYTSENANVSVATSLQDIATLSQDEQRFLPSLQYQMHIFSSEKQERWVKINGQSLSEGDELVNGLTLLEIRQNIIVWQTDTRRFSQRALEDFN